MSSEQSFLCCDALKRGFPQAYNTKALVCVGIREATGLMLVSANEAAPDCWLCKKEALNTWVPQLADVHWANAARWRARE